MKNARFNRLFSLGLCITMMISLCGCRSTKKAGSTGQSDQHQTENKTEGKTIAGFEKAEYEKFNSFAKDNGLRGTRIYFDGVIGDVRYVLIDQSIPGSDSLYLSITQDDGKEWLLKFMPEPITDRTKLESMAGKKVRAFCVYEGLSNDYLKPAVSLYYERCWITLEEKQTFTWQDFTNNVETIAAWCDENNRVLYVDDIEDETKQGTLEKTSGVIDSVSVDNSDFTIFTKSETDSLKTYTYNTSTPLLSDKPLDIAWLKNGDNVVVYYWIGFDSVPYIISVKKVEDVGITQDDIFTFISKDYKAYTYKEIARNPDKVKGNKAIVSGKIIQVIEEGDMVGLRVNISRSDWGLYTDTVFVTYMRKSSDEDRFLEDDIITILGTLDGLYTYEAVSGAQVTLPLIQSDYIKILE